MNRSRENLAVTISADWLCQLYPLRSTCQSHVAAQLSRTLSDLDLEIALQYKAHIVCYCNDCPRVVLGNRARRSTIGVEFGLAFICSSRHSHDAPKELPACRMGIENQGSHFQSRKWARDLSTRILKWLSHMCNPIRLRSQMARRWLV